MRVVPLTLLKGGINRLRVKGGARADSLYDLVNGYVTEAGTARTRPGTVRSQTVAVPLTTKGLVGFQDALHVFSHQAETVPAGVINHILSNPVDVDSEIEEIHFGAPYLGYLYVVAEFDDETVAHFWLASSGEWEADKVYKAGDLVLPTVPNGLLYRAVRAGPANASWAANVPRAIDDVVEPTVYNNFYYTVVEVEGTSPRSGVTEPAWPLEPGATVYEDADNDTSGPVTTPTTPAPETDVPSDIVERYY